MVEKRKADVDTLLMVLKLKKSSILSKYIGHFFSFLKPKVVYLRPFLSSLSFPKFWKQKLTYFGHKHVATGSNFSHAFATFFKYHMP